MAYRRRQSGLSRASTFEEEVREAPPDDDLPSSPSSLAAQAIRASSAHRDSSLSSAYGQSAYRQPPDHPRSPPQQVPSVFFSPLLSSPLLSLLGFPFSPNSYYGIHSFILYDSPSYEYTSMNNLNEPKYGFWGVLARKAKSVLEDDNLAKQFNRPDKPSPNTLLHSPSHHEMPRSYSSPDKSRKADSPSLHKGLDAITSSLNYIGGTIGNAFEEGLAIVENRTADIIQETRKLNIRRKGNNFERKTQASDVCSPSQQHQMETEQETQLKASRDVAMAMAAKAKLLLRELKTVKADLAFAKERCAQLEEENRILRESRDKGVNPEDDDLIRLQLETLLAEKARLAHENSVYARENRFLREIVEYHQLTMQDVVYLDEGIEEVTEVCPISIPAVRDTSLVGATPPISPAGTSSSVSPADTKDISISLSSPPEVAITAKTDVKDISILPSPPPVVPIPPIAAPVIGDPISKEQDMPCSTSNSP
ncbi:hypothetical protein Sjap_014407 [Stephania japonica]|uniref:Uncharacterized protein n=1 Tax=Stephania japonica TaxID=461633 RepID=A0AAP0J0L3_9MAGN